MAESKVYLGKPVDLGEKPDKRRPIKTKMYQETMLHEEKMLER